MRINSNIRWLTLTATLLSISSLSTAGEIINAVDTIPVNNWSFGINHHLGSFIANQPKSEYIRDSYTSLTEIFIEKKTNGEADWHLSHKYPAVGLGLIAGNPGSREYIGNLYAVYPYIRFPLLHTRRYEASIKTGGGLAVVGKPYDVYSNPKNTLIGTRFNVFLSFVLQNEVKLSERFHLAAGIGIMHVSNGSTKLPNLGLNIPNLSAGIRYALGRPNQHKRTLLDTSSSKIDFAAYTSISVKQYPWVGGSYYLINAAQLEASKRTGRNSSFGLGALLLYDRTIRRYAMEDRTGDLSYQKFQAGLYLSYEHFLGRLSIPVNIGAYLYNGSSSGIFQQYGIRYKATDHVSTQLLLKSHSGQAEFIHIGVGYNF
ncbi:acyloxyacyl hydrolase [Terrimonas sp. NA20]|uniref:Acyloxyacyl hydrolase n=1 Tax=Terrimonas ginsenosidimutans TaxID=2908004 RepID=A0ABS9KRM0_9BACT|nr:acyloxyacyl hydrolase [Terrimonas ginsenosidimutans]MCG2614924.1 acyloxyacyl hydrolase [Terrimonas ginsenosidimutans]